MAIPGIEGLDRLVGNLRNISDKGSRKAARAGVNAGLTVLGKHIRQWVNSTPCSPRLKRAARMTIGKSLKMKGNAGYPQGKAGFGVGKQSKRRRVKASIRWGNRNISGMGVSANNIHWFVLGTNERSQKKSGKKTGKIDPVFKGVIPAAIQTAQAPMLAAAAHKTKQVLAAEAAKSRKR